MGARRLDVISDCINASRERLGTLVNTSKQPNKHANNNGSNVISLDAFRQAKAAANTAVAA